MMYTGLHENLKTGIWPKCAATATKIENIAVNPHKEKFAHEKFYKKMPDYKKYFRTFGEMVVVRSIATVKAKLEDLVNMCMFLGYAQYYTVGTSHMLNIRTKYIILSHDVIFSNKTYGEYVSRKENTKSDSYILKNKYDYYKRDHIKIDPVNN